MIDITGIPNDRSFVQPYCVWLFFFFFVADIYTYIVCECVCVYAAIFHRSHIIVLQTTKRVIRLTIYFFLLFSAENCVHIATEKSNIDILRRLVWYGADINARVS